MPACHKQSITLCFFSERQFLLPKCVTSLRVSPMSWQQNQQTFSSFIYIDTGNVSFDFPQSCSNLSGTACLCSMGIFIARTLNRLCTGAENLTKHKKCAKDFRVHISWAIAKPWVLEHLSFHYGSGQTRNTSMVRGKRQYPWSSFCFLSLFQASISWT